MKNSEKSIEHNPTANNTVFVFDSLVSVAEKIFFIAKYAINKHDRIKTAFWYITIEFASTTVQLYKSK